MTAEISETGIGKPARRKEDFRFITGSGHYTDDINRPRQTYASFLRSPHAHAKIRSIDTSEAEKATGVLAIFTGKDIAADELGGLICGWTVTSKDGEPMKVGPHPVIALDTVRYVGDHVAMVVAETREDAEAAAELIDVDYEPLPAAVSLATCQNGDAPQVHAEAPKNTCFEWELGNKAETEAAFAKADRVVSLDLENNRLIPNAMEPRAARTRMWHASSFPPLWAWRRNTSCA